MSSDAPAAATTTTVVVFTKDRPFQCREALRTLGVAFRGAAGALEGGTAGGAGHDGDALEGVQLHVIAAASSTAVADAYARLREASPSNVMWHAECDAGGGFAGVLLRLLHTPAAAAATHYVMFMVDDVLWLAPPPLAHAAHTLAGAPHVLAYMWKMHSGVAYSHAAGVVCEPPPLTSLAPPVPPHATEYTAPRSLAWRLRDGTGDWGYAWDLCASLYRAADVCAMLTAVVGPPLAAGDALPDATLLHAVRQPNALEMALNAAWHAAPIPRRAWAACPTHAACVVVTVNRVQDVCRAPVYRVTVGAGAGALAEAAGAEGATLPPDDPVAHAAVATAWHAARFDVPWYAAQAWDRVHVGAWRLAAPAAAAAAADAPPPPPPPTLSIVLPVYNAAAWVAVAVRSIVAAAVAAVHAGEAAADWQLVVVDDASTDGSGAVAVDAAAAAGARAAAVCTIVRRTNGGVTAALNDGMAAATGDLVARMDADDIADVTRLTAQLRFLRGARHVDAVGCGVTLFGTPAATGCEVGQSVVVLPCYAPLLPWHATFLCPLAHPTVVLRRSLAAKIAAACTPTCPFAHHRDGDAVYDAAFPAAEDAALWAHGACHGAVIANLPAPLVALRKHGGSVSSAARVVQHASAAAVTGCVLRSAGWQPPAAPPAAAARAAAAAGGVLRDADSGDADAAADALHALRFLLDAAVAADGSAADADADAAAERRAVRAAIVGDAYGRACVTLAVAVRRHGLEGAAMARLLTTFMSLWEAAPLPPWLPRAVRDRIRSGMASEPAVAIAIASARALRSGGSGGGGGGGSGGGGGGGGGAAAGVAAAAGRDSTTAALAVLSKYITSMP